MSTDRATIEEVIRFAQKNTVPAKKGFVCVDGRYDAKMYAGMLARPGGNFRGILVLLALRKKLKMPVGRIIDKVVDAVERMGIPFAIHTDEHNLSEDLTKIGCGHIALAENPEHAEEYGVNPNDVKNALIYLRIKLEGRKYFSVQNLDGMHNEKGVLIITGVKNTVTHWDKKTGEMFFVYDKARDDKYMAQLYNQFKAEFHNLSEKDFMKMSDMQLNATLHNLAKGLPIFELNLDAKEPQVKEVGHVS